MSRTIKRPYTKSKQFDKSCRNHGGCPYCEGNRTFNNRRAEIHSDDLLADEVLIGADVLLSDDPPIENNGVAQNTGGSRNTGGI